MWKNMDGSKADGPIMARSFLVDELTSGNLC